RESTTAWEPHEEATHVRSEPVPAPFRRYRGLAGAIPRERGAARTARRGHPRGQSRAASLRCIDESAGDGSFRRHRGTGRERRRAGPRGDRAGGLGGGTPPHESGGGAGMIHLSFVTGLGVAIVGLVVVVVSVLVVG